ncbi:hypothetical protein Tco_1268932, partial [Tanacetum coccineum]
HGWSSVVKWYAIACGWYSLRNCGALCTAAKLVFLAGIVLLAERLLLVLGGSDCFILCLLLPQDMVTHTIDIVASVLTHQELDHFCNTYNIPADLGPELHGRKDTIRDAPAGKIGIYTRFLEFANFCVPLSRFLLCQRLDVFLRRGRTPCCLLKNLDSLKNWNDHIFWIDAFICPISVPWHTGASILKDPLPSDDRVNAELLALLDHHQIVIKRYSETFLCLVGLSRSFDDVFVRPTLLKDDESDMGLLYFVKSFDPFKIVDHTIMDEVKEHAGKKKRRVVFEKIPAKRLRADATTVFVAVPTTGGKILTALKRIELQSGPQGVGSSSVPPPI